MSDNKFLTSAQPKIMNPKENIKMTPGERSEGRKGLKTAVTAGIGMFPYGRALQGAGKVAGAFINTAKQYANLAKGGKVAKKTSNFRPLVTGNKVYGRKEINDAFRSRFGSPAKPKDIMGRPQAIPADPKNVIKKATQGKDALTHLKKVKKMASNAGPKNSFKGLSSQSSTRRTNLDNLSRKYKNK